MKNQMLRAMKSATIVSMSPTVLHAGPSATSRVLPPQSSPYAVGGLVVCAERKAYSNFGFRLRCVAETLYCGASRAAWPDPVFRHGA